MVRRVATSFLLLLSIVGCAPETPEGSSTAATAGASGASGASAGSTQGGKGGSSGAQGGNAGAPGGAAGAQGGAGGAQGGAAGAQGGAAGAQGGAAGAQGGAAGAQGGSAGAQGGSAGAQGGVAGAQGGSAGAQGGAAGAQGGSAGAQGGSAGAQGGSAGAQGGSAGAQGGSAGAQGGASPNPAITVPWAKGTYTIDQHEVTVGEYADWILSAPNLGAQPSVCSWNGTFQPAVVPSGWPTVTTGRDMPIRFVNWCDAYAYCADHGRRLCGKPGGGAVPWTSRGEVGESQWHNACTSGGQNQFVYGGSVYLAGRCNVGNADASNMVVDVESYPLCQSTSSQFQGVYDLTGNVWEWEDSCDQPAKGPDAQCSIRGAAWDITGLDTTCGNTNFAYSRDAADGFVGFRCCSQ